jgi:hypothetical protein
MKVISLSLHLTPFHICLFRYPHSLTKLPDPPGNSIPRDATGSSERHVYHLDSRCEFSFTASVKFSSLMHVNFEHSLDTVGPQLGKGGYGDVFSAFDHRHSIYVAIKVINGKTKLGEDSARREAKALRDIGGVQTEGRQ